MESTLASIILANFAEEEDNEELFEYILPIAEIHNISILASLNVDKLINQKNITFYVKSNIISNVTYFNYDCLGIQLLEDDTVATSEPHRGAATSETTPLHCAATSETTPRRGAATSETTPLHGAATVEDFTHAITKVKEMLPDMQFDKLTGRFSLDNITSELEKQCAESLFISPNVKLVYEDCSVCQECTTTKTKCKHPLCYPCWEKIKQVENSNFIENTTTYQLCPICREIINYTVVT